MNDSYLQPYRDAQPEHGDSFGITLWTHEETQRLRFAVFTESLFLPGKRLLDAGSSRGDLAAYLLEKGIAYGHYHGVDGLPEVIAFAQTRGLPDATFAAGDFVTHPELLAATDPQVTLISGTLNTMDTDTAVRVLDAAWAGCSEALAFNFLSDRHGPDASPQEYPARRLPTLKLLDWALQRTSDVVLRQDYFRHGHDATIIMKKP